MDAHVVRAACNEQSEPERCLSSELSFKSMSLAAYHHSLLETLRIHSMKLQRTRPASTLLHDPDEVARRNAQDLFEIEFLMIIRFYSLDEHSISDVPGSLASLVQAKLTNLLASLNNFTNVNLKKCIGEIQQNFVPLGPYARLEEVLNYLSCSTEPVAIASSCQCSLFQFRSTSHISEVQQLTFDLSTALMDMEQQCSAYHGVKVLPLMTRSNHDVDHEILDRLESSFRTPIAKMLDMIQTAFGSCSGQSQNRCHQVLLRLLDAQSLVESKVNCTFHLFLSCPTLSQWQHTCCNWHPIGSLRSAPEVKKRLCQLIKSSLFHLERLDLDFGQESTEFKPIRNLRSQNDPVLDSNHHISLKHLINESRAFDPVSRPGNPHLIFNHKQRRLLAANLGMNLLVFYSWHHSTKVWDTQEIIFFGLSTDNYDNGIPYVFCSPQVEPLAKADENDDDDDDPIPCFTLFAKLLLEIEYGRIETAPECDFSEQNYYGYHYIKNFYKAKRDYRDLSRQAYLNAVEACLNFRRDYDHERCTMAGKSESADQTCRRLIFTNIINNILTDLQPTPKRPLRRRDTEEHSERSQLEHEEFGPIETSVTWGSGYAERLKSDEISKRHLNEQHTIRASDDSKSRWMSDFKGLDTSPVPGADSIMKPGRESTEVLPLGKTISGRVQKRVRVSTDNNEVIKNASYLLQEYPTIESPSRTYSQFTIAWICALDVELAAGLQLMDEKLFESSPYYFGRMGRNHVIMTCLPAGQIGNTAAAIAATRMRDKFPSIQHCVLVGIGGGVPSHEHDVRLGDVVIGMPIREHGGVVQWDSGKISKGGLPIRTGTLSRPSDVLLHAVTNLRTHSWTEKPQFVTHLRRFSHLRKFVRPKNDVLYMVPAHSTSKDPSGHVESEVADRPPRDNEEPELWFGTIATGNSVIKDGPSRDRISQELGGIICFEMEAAGVLNIFPCLVVRGICDYADSHKNKIWQPYAAATAAACAKELLSAISTTVVT